MGRFASQIQQYQANNRGKVPNNTAVAAAGAVYVSQKAKTDFGTNITYPYSGTSTRNGTVSNATTGAGMWSGFLENYMWAANDTFTDPGGTPYGVTDHGSVAKDANNATSGARTDKMDYIIHVWHGAVCGTTEGTVSAASSGSTRKLAFVYKLEGAGYYCGEV